MKKETQLAPGKTGGATKSDRPGQRRLIQKAVTKTREKSGFPRPTRHQSARAIPRPRPLSANYVMTPGGPRHQSLLHIIKPGEKISRIGGILYSTDPATGIVTAFTESRAAWRGLPAFDGWVTSSAWNNSSGNPISRFAATWTVPQPPRVPTDGQYFYIFIGLQDVAVKPTCILQPVLQWGESPFGGGPYWTVGGWFVDDFSGTANRNPLVQVDVGTPLTGVMSLTARPGGGFDYSCGFQGIAGTNITGSIDVELQNANVTLECHNFAQWTDYPATPMTAIGSVQIQTGGTTVTPFWAVDDKIQTYGEHTTVLNNGSPGVEMDIYYGNPPP